MEELKVEFDLTPAGWSGYGREPIAAAVAALMAQAGVQKLVATRQELHAVLLVRGTTAEIQKDVRALRKMIQAHHPALPDSVPTSAERWPKDVLG